MPSMTTLPRTVLERFMVGEHVMSHIQGVWNGIWSDMFIETTFMRYGHKWDNWNNIKTIDPYMGTPSPCMQSTGWRHKSYV